MHDLWNLFGGTTRAPAPWVSYGAAGVALVAVGYSPLWLLLRHVVTIAHEGGHAAVATLTGRRLRGVRLHSDTSGLTVSAGKPTGLGVVLTLLAGYVAPSLLGVCAVLGVRSGHVVATLWVAIGLLALLLIQVRNLFGLLSTLLTGAALVVVSHWAPGQWQQAAAYLLAWFLLIAAPRPVLELQRSRRRSGGRMSDADQLARLTGIPGIFWVAFFLLVTVAALVLGGFGLVPR